MDITIVRVGARAEDIPLDAAQALRGAGKVILHTRKCGCAKWLTDNGIAFSSLDDIYERAEDFDAHARMAAEAVQACGEPSVHYCVMNLADESVKPLFECGARVNVVGGGDEGELFARARGATLLLCASDIGRAAISADQNTMVREIDTREMAGEVKLKLMAHYPEEARIYVLAPGGDVVSCALTELDRQPKYDHACACLAPALTEITKLERFDFRQLMRLTATLRDPEKGCPWDREQTHDSMKRCVVEEAYEVQDAIERGDEAALCEELGDLIFNAALQIQIAMDHGEFDDMDVLTGVARKMISRHSHVFGSDRAENYEALMKLWNRAKNREKTLNTPADEMRAVAEGLPALMRAQKVMKKARKAGDAPQTAALVRASEGALPEDAGEEELGDALLRMVCRAQALGLDAEKALEDAVSRFIERYPGTSM